LLGASDGLGDGGFDPFFDFGQLDAGEQVFVEGNFLDLLLAVNFDLDGAAAGFGLDGFFGQGGLDFFELKEGFALFKH
jgi:hypothetical protein